MRPSAVPARLPLWVPLHARTGLDVVVAVDRHAPPPDVPAQWRQRCVADARSEGRRMWAGPALHLNGFAVPLVRDAPVVLRAAPADFVSLTAAARHRPGRFGPSSGTVGVAGLVRTADRRVVLVRRSPTVALHPSTWMATFGETIDPTVDLAADGAVDLHGVCVRALDEEFCVPADAVESVAVTVLCHSSDWAIGALVDVAVSAAEFTAAAPGASDRWEADQLRVVRCDPAALAGVLAEPGVVTFPGAAPLWATAA